MKKELDEFLCQQYPKIFKHRHADPTTTAMCWGFEHDSGWFNIINNSCKLIQWHIDTTRKNRVRALRINRALRTGNLEKIAKALGSKQQGNPRFLEMAEKKLAEKQFELVPIACPQVVAEQVKEKFGTLRFYYHGGDEFVYGVLSLAEAMSGVTCEVCGNPGTRNSSGWIRTTCGDHKSENE